MSGRGRAGRGPCWRACTHLCRASTTRCLLPPSPAGLAPHLPPAPLLVPLQVPDEHGAWPCCHHWHPHAVAGTQGHALHGRGEPRGAAPCCTCHRLSQDCAEQLGVLLTGSGLQHRTCLVRCISRWASHSSCPPFLSPPQPALSSPPPPAPLPQKHPATLLEYAPKGMSAVDGELMSTDPRVRDNFAVVLQVRGGGVGWAEGGAWVGKVLLGGRAVHDGGVCGATSRRCRAAHT